MLIKSSRTQPELRILASDMLKRLNQKVLLVRMLIDDDYIIEAFDII